MLDIKDNALNYKIFQDLRRGILTPYKKKDIEIALKGSVFTVVITDESKNSKPIGIARIVGDGKITFLIKDVVVHRDYKMKKIGFLIMTRLKEYIHNNACENAYICLFASKGTEHFYEKLGFYQRPNENQGSGMMIKLSNLWDVRKEVLNE